MKCAWGRLQLPEPVEIFFDAVIAARDMSVLPVELLVVGLAASLQGAR